MEQGMQRRVIIVGSERDCAELPNKAPVDIFNVYLRFAEHGRDLRQRARLIRHDYDDAAAVRCVV